MPRHRLHSLLMAGVSALGLRAGMPSAVVPTKPTRNGRRRDRSATRPNGSPLVFETLEPRILLSGDPLTAAAQSGIMAGLQALQTWSHDKLDQSAQLLQQLPVVSTSLGDLVDLPGTLQQHVVAPATAYLTSTSAPTIQGLAAALAADPAETGAVLPAFSQGEFLVTLSALSTSASISPALNLTEDTAGINLQVGSGPVLTGTATVEASLTFGFDTNTGNFFIKPSQITQGVTLSNSSFSGTADLGAADTTFTGGSASLTATATTKLIDPRSTDTNPEITTADLANTASATLAPTLVSGTGALTLPLTSNLVSGTQTLDLNWSGNLASVGQNNLATLGAYAGLDTITPALVQKAVAALPTILDAAAGQAGFGHAVDVLGSNLGDLFNVGADAAGTAAQTATTLDGIAAAVHAATGGTLTFAPNAASNGLTLQFTASTPFSTTVPFTFDQSIDGQTLAFSSTVPVSGTASAAVQLNLSYDTTLADTDRITTVADPVNSLLGLSFDAMTATPIIAAAALGLTRVTVSDGSLEAGALTNGAVDPTKPATFSVSLTGGISLTSLSATPGAALKPATGTGGLVVSVSLADGQGDITGPITTTYDFSRPGNPGFTNANAITNVATAPSSLVQSAAVPSVAATDLQQIGGWASAIETSAAAQTATGTTISLLGESLAQATDLAGVLSALTSGIAAGAQAGASASSLSSSVMGALQAYAASQGGTLTPGAILVGLVPASNATAAASLGLPQTGNDLYYLSIAFSVTTAQSVTLAESAADNADGVAFSLSAVPASSTVSLQLTLAVDLTPNFPAPDALLLRLDQLQLGLTANTSGASTTGAIGFTQASLSNITVALSANASLAQTATDSAGPEMRTISEVQGASASTLLAATVSRSTLTVSATAEISLSHANDASGTVTLSADPLAGTAPVIAFPNNPGLQNLALVSPNQVLSALQDVGDVLTSLGQSSLLNQPIPLTDQTIGDVLTFGTAFTAAVVTPLTGAEGGAGFSSAQGLLASLQALPGATGVSVDFSNNQLNVSLTLAETFSTPVLANVEDNLTSTNQALALLTDLGRALLPGQSTPPSLSITGTGQVQISFGILLGSQGGGEIQGGALLPASFQLPSGDDAHFTLSFSGGVTDPGPVDVTVASAATQSNTKASDLVGEVNAALQLALSRAGLSPTLVMAQSISVTGGTKLVLKLAAGVYTTFELNAGATDPAVTIFGLGSPGAGATASISANAPLPSSGVLLSAATFSLSVDGDAPTAVMVPATTSGSPTQASLLASIQTALAGFNAALPVGQSAVTASVDGGNHLVLGIAGYGQSLQLTASGAAITELGLPASKAVTAGSPQVTLEANGTPLPLSGQLTNHTASFDISVDGRAMQTVTVSDALPALLPGQDPATNVASVTTLVAQINKSLAPVNADLQSAGLALVTAAVSPDGQLVFTTSGFAASITISSSGGAAELGIGAQQTSAPPMVMAIGSTDIGDEVQVNTLALSGAITVGGSIDATAHYGASEVTLTAPTVSYGGAISLSLSGSHTLDDLASAGSALINDFGTPSLTGTGSVTLAVTADAATTMLLGLDANAAITLSSGGSNLFDRTQWTANTSALEGVATVARLTFTQVSLAITQLGALLTNLSANGELAQALPLLDEPAGQVFDIGPGFVAAAKALAAAAPTVFTIDQLQGLLNTALETGLHLPTGSYVGIALSGDVLQVTLTVSPAIAPSTASLDLNLAALGVSSPSTLPGVTTIAGGSLTVTPTAMLTIKLDIDFTNPAAPTTYLDGASTFDFGLLIAGATTGSLSIGPLGVLIEGGTIALGSKADQTKPATIAIGFAAGSRYLLTDLVGGSYGWAGGSTFQTTVNGAVNLNVTLATPTAGDTQGNLVLSIPDLGTFLQARTNGQSTTSLATLTSPDFTQTFKTADLLGNSNGVLKALDGYFTQLQQTLDNNLFAQDLPLIGNGLMGAATFLQDLQHSLDTNTELLAASGLADVQKALTDALGTLLKSPVEIYFTTTTMGRTLFNGSNAPADVQDITDIEFSFTLGGQQVVEIPFGADLGLPGFNIGATAGDKLDVTLNWTAAVDFGTDRASGLYIKPSGTQNDFMVAISASLAAGDSLTAQLGLLSVSATQVDPSLTDPSHPTIDHVDTGIDLILTGGFSSSNEISLGAIGNSLPGFSVIFSGSANIDLDLALGFGFSSPGVVDAQFPTFDAVLQSGFEFSSNSFDGGAVPTVALNDIQLDFGSFINGYLGQIFGPINNLLGSIEPILNILTYKIPVLNETLIDLASALGGDVQNASEFLDTIAGILQFAQDFSSANQSGLPSISFGSVSFGGYDLRQGGALPANDAIAMLGQSGDLGGLATSGDLDSEADADDPTFGADMSGTDGSISLPILDDPTSLLSLLFGKDVVLFDFVTPQLVVTLTQNYSIPIPVFPIVSINFGFDIGITARLGIGYDTYGIREALADTSKDPGSIAADLADGFYIDEAPLNGEPTTEIGLTGGISVGAGVDLGIVDVSVDGGLQINLDLSAKTSGPTDSGLSVAYHEANDNDDKARLKEILDNISDSDNPLCAFTLTATVSLRIFVDVSVAFVYNHEFDLADITLFSFSADLCPPVNEDLATQDPTTGLLTLNTGPNEYLRGSNYEQSTDDFELSQGGDGDVIVHANGSAKTYENVTGIVAILGNGDNSLVVDSPLVDDNGNLINETIVGGTGNDTIVAGGGDDVIAGGGGADKISGSSTGTDTIYADGVGTRAVSNGLTTYVDGPGTLNPGHLGDATISGGQSGFNLIYGGYGDDTFNLADTGNTVYGGPGSEHINAAPGDPGAAVNGDFIAGGGGDDTIVGGTGNDTLAGDGGTNLIIGGNGNNLVYGGVMPADYSSAALALFGDPAAQPEGSNLVFGGTADQGLLNAYRGAALTGSLADLAQLPANDPSEAMDGNDMVTAGTGGDHVFGGFKQNTIYGGGGADTLVGATTGDTFFGGAGNSLIYGRGADLINGGAGDSTIYGGPGHSTIFGDTGSDLIYGGNAGNTIFAGSGNTTIYAGDGNDSVLGGSGHDLIHGGGGTDTIQGGSGASTLFGDDGNDTIDGGSGNDSIFGDDGEDVLRGGAGNSSLYGGHGTDTIHGGPGADYISGVGGNDDSIFGGSGNDTIQGGGAGDTINGGEGNSLIYAGTGPAQITGGSGDDTITGGAGFDVILGGTGNDSIAGASGEDVITGGSGSDTIVGGSASDTIYAGDGASLLTGGGGTDLLVGGVAADTIIGGSGAATIYAGQTGGNVIIDGSGVDIIHGSAGAGTPGHGDTIIGGAGAATIYGSAGDDSITGGNGGGEIDVGPGNATVLGGLGALLIIGGIGSDLLEAGLSGALDTIMGGRGADTITGNAGDDDLEGGYGRDSISGGTGTSAISGGYGIGKTIYGGSGDDTIYASDAGQNVITGGAGNDEIHGAGGGNTITGGAGNDTIEGGPGDDSIIGGAGNDLLAGDAGNDTIYAGDPAASSPSIGADTIYGDFATLQTDVSGDDVIVGNAGNDVIFGGLGNDQINPGTGSGTQMFEGGTLVGASYVATPTPNPTPVDPRTVPNPAATATLPANLPTAGIWVPLAGDPGSSLAQAGTTGMGTSIAISGDTRYVAWVDSRSGVNAVYVAAQTGSAWSELAGSAEQGGVSGVVETASNPTLALLADGTPIVAWTVQTQTGTDIQLAKYSATANGGAGGWVALGTSLSAGGLSGTGHATAAQLVIVGNMPVVAWLDTSSGVANVYAKEFNGTSWVALGSGAASGSGVTASATAIPSFSLATDGANVALAWTQPSGAGSQIYLKQESNGAWSSLGGSASGGGLSKALYPASAPAVAYDNGVLFVAWQQYVTDPGSADTIYDSAPVIYATRYINGTWLAAGAGAETGLGISANAGINTHPVLASDNGVLLLGWSNTGIGDTAAVNHLYLREWDGTEFAEALPGQATGDGVASGQSAFEALDLAVDASGRAFASWIDRGTATPGLHVAGSPTAPNHLLVADATHSIQGLLATAVPGDVIFVTDQAVTGALTLSAADDGVTLVGQTGGGAVIGGLLTITGNSITVQGLTLAGGVTISGTADTLDAVTSSGVITIGGTGANVFNSRLPGVILSGATGFELRGNTIRASGTGVQIGVGNAGLIDANTIIGGLIGLDVANAFTGLISGNTITGSGTGVEYDAAAALIGNTISDNGVGVVSSIDNSSGGFGFTPGSGQNTITANHTGVMLNGASLQGQLITNNQVGVSGSGIIGGATLDLANEIKGNVTGISGFTGTIQFSRIESNGTGIVATANLHLFSNIIARNTTVGLLVSGVDGVRTSDNTFYTATGDNVRLQDGASDFEIQNSILWSESGYDIYVANDSQTGFFSDYNVLYAGASGTLVYWTRDFTDILDWQDDVAEFDLHSTGRTVVNPEGGKPHFADLAGNDFTIQDIVGGQRLSSPSVDEGSPLVEHDVQPQNGNLLTNPGFENGFTGWTANAEAQTTVASGNPAPYDGNEYYDAGNTATGQVSQTVNLLQAGYSAADIDAGLYTLQFGGYTRSYAQQPADQGSISVLFFDANNDLLGSSTIQSLNTTSLWSLTSGTAAIPVGTRLIAYEFTAIRQSGTADDAYLDDAYANLVPTSTAPQAALPNIAPNYLVNAGFETGLGGWQTNASATVATAGAASGDPAAYDGAGYFSAGATQLGFATQTVDLLANGLSATQIDSGALDLVYGGRVRSADELPADEGQITVTFYAADGTTQLGAATAAAPNTSDRWALLGGRVAIPTGARFVTYNFQATRESGSTDDSFLDDAFVSTVAHGADTAAGAYPAANPTPESGGPSLALTYPDLYTDWEDTVPHTITWNSFGDADASSVRIDLLQDTPDGPVLLTTIASAVADTGSYVWIPANSGIGYGTYGLRIQISLVNDPGVFDRSAEPFTVPENGNTYYVNDDSTANDQYTTAVGSNRNDGKLPSAPKPDPVNVLRVYTLGAGSTIEVDPGTYNLIHPIDVSGNVDAGLGLDQGFVLTGPTNGSLATLEPAIPDNRNDTLVQLSDANFVTVENLTLTDAGRAIEVDNSSNFSGIDLTITNVTEEGIRITGNVAAGLLQNVSVSGAGLDGIYISGVFGTLDDVSASDDGFLAPYRDPTTGSGLYVAGAIGTIEGGTFAGNLSYGVYLANAGDVSVTGLMVDGNHDGIYIYNGSSMQAVVGATDLTLSDGNIIYGNAASGLYATGDVLVAGNTVYDQTGGNNYGIEVENSASAEENVVYASADGISGVYAGPITENRVYDSGTGIVDYGYGLVVSDNIVYSNVTGIELREDYGGNTENLAANNLVYANTASGILVTGEQSALLMSDTVEASSGNAIQVQNGNTGSELRDDIIVADGAAAGVSVASDSENGFKSDYNFFQVTASGVVGIWQGVARTTLELWHAATTTDSDSQLGNPLFISPTGPDGVLGYVSPAEDGRDDDFHVASAYGSTQGGGLAPAINLKTGLPYFLPSTTAATGERTSTTLDRGAPGDPYSNEPSPNGGYINLGAYGDTPQASTSPSQFILVLQPSAAVTVQDGTTQTITWRAFGFTGTVSIAYSADGGTTFTSIAAGIADNGSYTWAVPSDLAPGSDYVIQVSADAAAVTGLSATFSVSTRIHDYYVNDGSTTGDQYSTAIGNDANDGLTPATPKATIQGIIEAYTLGAGDTILVDTGTYSVTTNITLTSAVSGTDANDTFTIQGPTEGGVATLDRGNQSSGATVFTITNAAYVTIQGLTLTDASSAIEVTGAAANLQLLNDTISNTSGTSIHIDDGAGATNLVIAAGLVTGTGNTSGDLIYLGSGNTGALVANETTIGGYYGIELEGVGQTVQGGQYSEGFYGDINAIATSSLVEGATVFNNNHDGVYSRGTVTGVVAFGNTGAGIEESGGTVIGSTAYGETSSGSKGIVLENGALGSGNVAYLDLDGIVVSSYATATGNVAYDDSDAGIQLESANGGRDTVTDNTVYGDGAGIGGSLYDGGFGNNSAALLQGNVVYDNTNGGVVVSAGHGLQIINNTIDQATGPAIALSGGGANSDIENNILVVAAGPAISVAFDSEVGFTSDYNLFDPTGTGSIGMWEGQTYTSLASWYYEIGVDQHSQVGDPGIVNPAGPDGILGFTQAQGTPVVIDNSDPGFTVTGTTTTRTDGVDGGSLVIAEGSGTVATWTFTGLVTGETYQLAATWPGNGSYYQSYGTALYLATDGSGQLVGSTTVNQNTGPSSNGSTTVPSGYAPIGTFIASSSTVTVTLTGSTTGPVLADAISLTALGVNSGADDDLHATAPITIDAGDPVSIALAEPGPNGGRVNVGSDGGSAAALTSPDPEVQVLSPAGLAKLQLGQQATIDFRTYDVAAEQPVLLVHAGGAAITTEEQGNWQGDAYRLNGNTYTTGNTVTGIPASLPAALFTSGAYADSGTGSKLSFLLPVVDGTYTLRLFFADTAASGVGQRVFDIVVNGVTMVANYDVVQAAGGPNKAVELDVTVTVTGGKGLALDLVNDAASTSGLPAFVDGIELDQVVANGASAPTATIQVSTDDGTTWSTIASNVAVNRFGLGQYVWTVDRTTVGNTALIRVISDGTTGTSNAFLLANSNTTFYVNDGSTIGDQYTTAIGNDANSGKSPDQPLVSLGALLRAYSLTGGDTVDVDTGTYTLPTDLTLGASDSGTAASQVTITGPTNGGAATLDRANLSSGTAVFHITGSYITVANLTLADASTVVDVTAGAGLSLLNDTVQGSGNVGIDIEGGDGITHFTLTGSTLRNNTHEGIYIGSGNTGALLSKDIAYDNGYDGFNAEGGGDTISGSTAYGNGIVYPYAGMEVYGTDSLVIDSLSYGNARNGIYSRGTVEDSTAFGNGTNAFEISGGTIIGSSAHDELSVYASAGAIILEGGALGSGNTVYGSVDGIYVTGGSTASGNRVYDNSGDGVEIIPSGTNVVTGNTIYGNGTGIGGDLRNYGYSGYTSYPATITNNLIYGNTTAGIAFNSGTGVVIDNNTVDQAGGPDIAVTGYANNETIENNIFVVSGSAAITVDSSSESDIFSDYNLFDLGAGGTIGSFAGLGYATLATWYYAVGEDQHSQVGDPGLVAPAGADGVMGFAPVAGTAVVVDNGGAGFSVTGPVTTLTSGVGGNALVIATGSSTVASWTFTGLVAGETYQLAATWPGSYQSYGDANYVATDATGTVLAGRLLGQNNSPSNTNFALPNNYALIGDFIATGSTITVSLTGTVSGPVIADAVSLTALGVNHGADDNFTTGSTSIDVDAGDPASVALLEPSPDGGRINQGYQGGTASAATSPLDPEVQVLSPAALSKLQLGQQATIDFSTYDVAAEQPVLLVHAGGAAITTAEQGDWQGDAYRLNGNTFTDDYPPITGVPCLAASRAVPDRGLRE